MAKNITKQELVDSIVMDEYLSDNLLYVEEIDSLFLYDEKEKYYKLMKDRSLEKFISDLVWGKEIAMSKNLIRDVIYLIKLRCVREEKEIPTEFLTFDDCILSLNNFQTYDFDKKKISTHKINYNYNGDKMQTPLFNKFLADVFIRPTGEKDEQLIHFVQEMCGFYIMPVMKPEAFFILYGGGSNGKSTLIELIEMVIGRDFISALSLEQLSGKFNKVDLIGKRLNIVKEEESKYIKIDTLKNIVSGEGITAERKFETSITFIPKTKILIGTNNYPSFSSIDHSIERRMNIIPFNKRFEGENKDEHFKDNVKKELPGIIHWMIEGAKRLHANNYKFSYCAQVIDTYKEFERHVSSAVEFISENYVATTAQEHIANDILYLGYAQWCINNGRKACSSNNFHKEIASIMGIKSESYYDYIEKRTKKGKRLKPNTD